MSTEQQSERESIERALKLLCGRFDRYVEDIATDLERLAAEVRRQKSPSPTTMGRPHTHAATSVISSVHNALPNMRLGLLAETAVEIDVMDVSLGTLDG